ncbi:MAG TPA: tetratricopeptide repeat protein [Bryobacteraceae bacterium]|nr:tetratricopeptide repeat protein [Bryobacteraceae bacterium]
MSFRLKPLIPAAFAALLFCAVPGFSQTAFVQGVVKGPDGAVIQGAIVAFEGVEMKNKTQAKTDKKGHYITSMKPAIYEVTVTVDGTLRAKIGHYEAVGGNGDPLDFTLQAAAAPGAAPAMTAAPAAAPASGGKGSKDDAEAQKKKEEQLAKNKALNDAFGAGRAAIDAKNWDEAITQLNKAAELGPTQQAVWAALAEAYTGKAKSGPSGEADASYQKAFEAYDKLIELKPDEAGTYNNYALALAADKKLDDAKVKLAKAVELDPAGAGKYHYNLGALLMNSSQTDGALDEFKKAIAADPNYAEAYFYLGSTLMGKATMDASGKMQAPPGTVEALQKYVQLKPDGPNADAAKQLIAALGSTVNVNYKDPNAPAKPASKKGK